MKYLKKTDIFDYSQTIASAFLKKYDNPWEAVPHIRDYVISLGEALDKRKYTEVKPCIWIANSAIVAQNCFIDPPCIIGERTILRSSAFIRGGVIVGNDCVIGNSTELKNCIVFNEVQLPHFNYVGDSIVGHRAHLGAGAVISNVKSDRSEIFISLPEGRVPTGLTKLGALVGDSCEVGCNAVINPGSVLFRGCQVYPLSFVRGYIPADSILKTGGEIVKKV